MTDSRTGRGPAYPDDGVGRDMEVASWLKALDPATAEPNYWLRFQSWVVKNAAAELARRRLMADLTMGDVMTSWARAVIPTAVLAAALAGLLLFRAQAVPAPVPMGVEELLIAGVEGATIPVTLSSEDVGPTVVFASEGF